MYMYWPVAIFLEVKLQKPLNSYLNQDILVCLLGNTIFAITIKSLKITRQNIPRPTSIFIKSFKKTNSRNKTFVNIRTMVNFFSFLIVYHVQCYLSTFWFSSSSQPSFICRTVPSSALPLFRFPDRIVLFAPRSDRCNYLEIYLNDDVKSEPYYSYQCLCLVDFSTAFPRIPYSFRLANCRRSFSPCQQTISKRIIPRHSVN